MNLVGQGDKIQSITVSLTWRESLTTVWLLPVPQSHLSSLLISLPMSHSHPNTFSSSNTSWAFLPPSVCVYYSLCPEHSPFPTINTLYPQFTSLLLLILQITVKISSPSGSLPWPQAWASCPSRRPHPSALSTPRAPVIAHSPPHLPPPPKTKPCGVRSYIWLNDCYTPRANRVSGI